MIAINQLTYQYRGESLLTFPDLVATDNHFMITGDSGAGKTTLLHLLAGLISPASGTIDYGSTRFTNLSPQQQRKFRNQHLALAPQEPAFIAALRMMEYLRLIGGQSKALLPDAVDEILIDLHMDHLTNKKPHQLSGGEKQRFGLVVALMQNPQFLLVDEPTSSLDPTHAKRVIDCLMKQAERTNFQLVVVSHDARIAHHFDQTIAL